MILQIYNRDGSLYKEFTKVLNRDISFSNVLGSGQTSLSLDLEYSSWDLLSKFAKLFIGERLVFFGEIIDEKFDFISTTSIVAYGLYESLNCVAPRLTLDTHGAWAIYLGNIVNQRYPVAGISFDIQADDTFTKTYSNYTIGGQIMKDVVSDSKFDFFLGADGVMRFKENISSKVHNLSIGKNAEIIGGFIGRTKREYVSEVRGVETGINTEIKNEEESEKWGIVSRGIYSTGGAYTATRLAKELRAMLKSPPQKTQIQVKNNWDIEVGDFVTIENSKIPMENIKIVKIDYTLHTATLHLDSYSNIYKNLK